MAVSARITKKNLFRARRILLDVINFLEEEQLCYHLEGGTLLGLVRDKELLPWDHDIDLSISIDDAEMFRQRKWRLYKKGYMITHGKMKRDIGPLKKGQYRIFKVKPIWPNIFRSIFPIVKRYIIVADIFVKASDEKFTYWQAMDKIMKVDSRYYHDHELIEYLGRKLRVPHDYKNYLADKYGDWKTPVKSWNCAVDEKTVICDAG